MNWKLRTGFHEHTGVSLKAHLPKQPDEEDTPVCIRIQLSRATVKDLHSRLQHAYQRDDVRLVRRTTVLLDLLVHHVPVAVLCERWGLSPSCIYRVAPRASCCMGWTAWSTAMAVDGRPS